MTEHTKPVTLAAITGAHGVAGEVHLKLLGEGLDALKAHKSFNDGTLTLTKIRSDNKGGAIARFAECPDRNAAEALRGTTLTVKRDALPPLDDGEYYYADLIGLTALSTDGTKIGIVIAVQNFGASDVIEIEKPDGKTFMVPLIETAVPGWDDRNLSLNPDFAEI